MVYNPAVREDTNSDYSVSFTERKGGEYFMPHSHFHDVYEIYYLGSGQRYYFIKDKTYLINEGDLVFIGKNEIHRTLDASNPAHNKYMIQFSEDFIRPLLSLWGSDELLCCFKEQYPIIHPDVKSRYTIEGIILKMLSHIKNPGASKKLQLIFLGELLALANSLKSTQPVTDSAKASSLHSKVSDVVKYINSNYPEDLTLSSTAKTFFISSSYLSKIFHEATGFTFVEYLNHVRIKEAKKLLENSRDSMLDISEKTGFKSNTHFGRVFKELTGVSPLKYRLSFLRN